jgi:hypothetical protein
MALIILLSFATLLTLHPPGMTVDQALRHDWIKTMLIKSEEQVTDSDEECTGVEGSSTG